MNLVHWQIRKALCQAARPADFNPVDFRRRAQAEVNPHIAVGTVTGAAADFVHENARRGLNANPRADAIAVGFRSDGMNRDPVIRVVNLIHQQTGLRHSCC